MFGKESKAVTGVRKLCSEKQERLQVCLTKDFKYSHRVTKKGAPYVIDLGSIYIWLSLAGPELEADKNRKVAVNDQVLTVLG